MAKILILGDSHGNISFVADAVRNAKISFDIDYAIQVGDFGFYPVIFKNFDKFGKFEVPLYVIDGNHENHEWLHKQKKSWKQWKEKNLIFCPRGHTIEIDNRLIAFVGGAMNVDRPQQGSIDKRTTNYLLQDEVNEISEKLNESKRVDLMVTHSCPHSVGIGMHGNPLFDYMIERYIIDAFNVSIGPSNDVGEQTLLRLWKQLENKPLNWVFGHFHIHHYSKVEDTEFWCVGSTDHSDNNLYCIPYIYDTEENKVQRIEKIRI